MVKPRVGLLGLFPSSFVLTLSCKSDNKSSETSCKAARRDA